MQLVTDTTSKMGVDQKSEAETDKDMLIMVLPWKDLFQFSCIIYYYTHKNIC